MDTQQSVEELEAAGIEAGRAKAIVRVVDTALKDYPNVDRLERMLAEFRGEMRVEFARFREQMREDSAKFREEMREDFAKLRFEMIRLVVISTGATIISLLIAILLKH